MMCNKFLSFTVTSVVFIIITVSFREGKRKLNLNFSVRQWQSERRGSDKSVLQNWSMKKVWSSVWNTNKDESGQIIQKITFLWLTPKWVQFFLISFWLVSALKCWKCSSDEHQSEFCNDPFDLSVATEQQRRWAYVECSLPPGQSNPFDQPLALRAVCKASS